MDFGTLKLNFAPTLLKWNKAQNKRQMPWKGEKNPYFIWLSEIILQQTRVEQGLPYYQRFIKLFPTVRHLADAPQDEVMAAWQGLGYYSRARNLHSTAKHVTHELKEIFPADYEGLLALKGVGAYTAAAIASFAYNQPQAVVDGNVIRVLARYFGIDKPYDTTEGKKLFAALAQELIDKKKAAAYNQAIMDFGATVCTPKNPLCSTCPFNKSCKAYLHNRIEDLPVKGKKIKIKERYFHYLLITTEKEVLIQQRNAKDIWQHLYQLPLIESIKEPTPKELQKLTGVKDLKIVKRWPASTQMLSHQKIHFNFVQLSGTNIHNINMGDTLFVKKKSLKQFAFPQTLHLFLKQNSLL